MGVEKRTPLTYEAFYQLFHDEAFRYLCKKCSNREDADDLTQSVFTYCWQHFHEYDASKASYRTWLYVILLSRWKNYYKSRRSVEDIDAFAGILAEQKAIDAAVSLQEMRTMLAQQLCLLSEREQHIIVLRFFAQKSSAEVSCLLGTSENNVRQIQKRALSKLKTAFEKIDYHFEGVE